MKNYFPHDSDARSDDKIIALRIKHKWEGYGLYWALIEKLRESKNYTLKADYNVLAFDLRADAAILKSVINDFGLFAFTNNGECFYSESLNTRMQPLDEKRAKLSDAGKRGNEKRWKNGSNRSETDQRRAVSYERRIRCFCPESVIILLIKPEQNRTFVPN